MVRDRILPTTMVLTVWAATASAALGQSITPAADGTGTQIQTHNGVYTINGGRLSGDGANLFHSFQDLGLSSGEIANFLSQPQVQNILGRVVGGNPSHIDGLIQVLGGNSNLYLMNPAGLVFGANASLNVPADFVATTASGIGLGNGQWFDAIGSADYAALVGDPNAFAFDLTTGGAIVNAGNLTVNPGQHLGLVAQTVVNTGTLTASAGQITIAAVPDSSLVRISQPGQLLSLEIDAPRNSQGNLLAINPHDLPNLLTGASNAGLTDLGLTAETNSVTLTATRTAIPLATQSSLVSGSLDVSGAQGGEIAVLGQNVGLVGANLDAAGEQGGGTIRIGGEYHGRGGLPNATHTVVDAASTLRADAQTQGDGGRVIVWADQHTRFAGQVSARGGSLGGDGGFIEVSGKDTLAFAGTASTQATAGGVGQLLLDPRNITITTGSVGPLPSGLSDHFWDNAENNGDQTIGVADLRSLLTTNDLTLEANKNITWSTGAQLDTTGFTMGRTLTLQAGDDILFQEATPILTGGNPLNLTLIANQGDSQVLAQDPSTSQLYTNGGALTIQGRNQIHLGEITTHGGAVQLTNTNQTQLGNIATAGGRVELTLTGLSDLTTGTIDSGAGDIDLEGRNRLTVDAITTTSGTVSLKSAVSRADTTVGIQAQTITTDTGSVTLSSRNNLNVGTIRTNGGAVTLTNPAGRADPFGITTQDITTKGGAVTVNTLITTTLGNLSTNGGQIDLTSANNRVLTTGTLNSGAGNIGIDGRNNLNLGHITTTSGTVSLSSTVGRDASIGINAQDITTQGGQVAIASRNTTNLGHITTQGGKIELNISRNRVLQGGRLDSSSTTGNGGAIEIDSRGAVILALINAQGNSSSGTGGAINITTKRDFRVTGSFLAQDGSIASISNVGAPSSPPANIVIDYATRNPTPRFDLAASFSTSGTVGAITNRSQSLQPSQSFSSRDLGTIKILGSVDPIPDPDEPIIPPFSPSPFFGAIAPNPSDEVAPEPLPTLLEDLEGLNVADLSPTTSSSERSSAASFSGNGGGGSSSQSAAAAFAHAEQSFGSAFNAYFASGGGGAGASSSGSGSAASSAANSDGAIGGAASGAAGGSSVAPAGGSVGSAGAASGGTRAAAGVASGGFNGGNGGSGAAGGTGVTNATPAGNRAPAASNSGSGSTASHGGSTATGSGSGGSTASSTGGAQGRSGAAGGSNATSAATGNSSTSGSAGAKNGAANGASGTGTSGTSGGSSDSTQTSGGNGSTGNGSTGNGSAGNGSAGNGSSTAGGDGDGAGETATGAAADESGSSNDATADSTSDATVANTSSSDADSDSGSDSDSSGDGAAISIADAQASLRDIEAITGVSPALLYGIFAPPLGSSNEPQPTDQLHLILVLPNGDPILRTVPANREMVMGQARDFRRRVTNTHRQDYLPPAQQLYQWLIEPLQADIEAAEIEHLTFLLDSGLRSLPIAALHSGEEFLVEQYSLSLMPSMSLSDLSYRPITHMELLAMGTSTFEQHEPLPGAGAEVALLTEELWDGKSLQDEDFSPQQLKSSRSQTPYGMLHLATHSSFRAGTPQDSYIQMGNERLGLDELRQLGLHSPAIELMVLSACQTALGDTEAELGFAGLAVLAGVKTAVGSLWRINDLGTLGFMGGFYGQLREAPIKATALQQAQLSFLQGQVQVEASAIRTGDRTIPLPPELHNIEHIDFTHPYYWSAFTMIGTPW
ncbi:MAG: CHAT domain-containing protein [Cyanobacteria bacterium P01_G01_bin.54]